jgi:hypothetical protein
MEVGYTMSLPDRRALGAATSGKRPDRPAPSTPTTALLGPVAAAWLTDPRRRACSPGARLLWLELLPILCTAQRPGYLQVGGVPLTAEQIAGIVGASADDVSRGLAELTAAGVATVESGVVCCRLVVAAVEEERVRRLRKKIGGEKGAARRWIGTSMGIPIDVPIHVPIDSNETPEKRGDSVAAPSNEPTAGCVCISSSLDEEKKENTHTRGGGVGEGAAAHPRRSLRSRTLTPVPREHWPADFARVAAVYPHEAGIQKALAFWLDHTPDAVTVDTILNGIERWKSTARWKAGVRWVMDLERFLREAQWTSAPAADAEPSLFDRRDPVAEALRQQRAREEEDRRCLAAAASRRTTT